MDHHSHRCWQILRMATVMVVVIFEVMAIIIITAIIFVVRMKRRQILRVAIDLCKVVVWQRWLF